jgi:hypothetical protein
MRYKFLCCIIPPCENDKLKQTIKRYNKKELHFNGMLSKQLLE